MAGFIGDIDANVPGGNEDIRDGDDAIRDLAGKTRDSFPEVKGAVTKTHAELNACLQTLAVVGDDLVISNGNSVPLADISDSDAVQLNTLETTPIPEQHMKQTSLRITPDGSKTAALVLDGAQLPALGSVLLHLLGGSMSVGIQGDSNFNIAAVRAQRSDSNVTGDHNAIGHQHPATPTTHTVGVRTATNPAGYPAGSYLEWGIITHSTNSWATLMALNLGTGQLHADIAP